MMNRLAAVMMFAAWLLYGAMPAMAVPAIFPASPAAAGSAVEDHSGHHGMGEKTRPTQSSHAGHANGEARNPCPHGSGEGCMAPFCAACLVLLPDITFADKGRFVHPHPKPEAAPPLVVTAFAPPTPPPRA